MNMFHFPSALLSVIYMYVCIIYIVMEDHSMRQVQGQGVVRVLGQSAIFFNVRMVIMKLLAFRVVEF